MESIRLDTFLLRTRISLVCPPCLINRLIHGFVSFLSVALSLRLETTICPRNAEERNEIARRRAWMEKIKRMECFGFSRKRKSYSRHVRNVPHVCPRSRVFVKRTGSPALMNFIAWRER